MIHFVIILFCIAVLFLTLLEGKYRVWTTLAVTAGVYLVSLAAAFLLRRLTDGAFFTEQLPCVVGTFLFFVSSLFLFSNNILQKLFIALLSLCGFTYLNSFLPLFLGVMPFSTAGAFASVCSALLTVLFFALMALCLYRPLHHFSDRGVSGFMVGMCLLLCLLYPLSLGKFDFLFRAYADAGRLFLSTVLYGVMIFSFRSIYQAGRFRESVTKSVMRDLMLKTRSADFSDSLTTVREVRSVQKSGEYALDTVSHMLGEGRSEEIDGYIRSAKETGEKNPILVHYHDNPYLNAVIASKAAFAAQNGVDFSCSMATGNTPLRTAEACVIVSEMLALACKEAAAHPGEKKLRFTAIPGEDALRFEAVYSAEPTQEERFTLKGKSWNQLLSWLFRQDDPEEGGLKGLENTEDILERYSGSLSRSGTPGEVILTADLRF